MTDDVRKTEPALRRGAPEETAGPRTDELTPSAPSREIVPVHQAAFFTDSNRLTKETQDRTWSELAFELFAACRERYLAACALVGVEPELARLVRAITALEPPRLARTYRKIAAFYRFAFVGEPQTELPFDDRDHLALMETDWRKFFRLETQRLARIDHLARSVLRAVAFGVSAEGRVAEAHVVDVLNERYGRFHLARRMELLKLSIHPEELEGWRFLDGPDWDQYQPDPRVRPDPPA